jgi:hypothetical protein
MLLDEDFSLAFLLAIGLLYQLNKKKKKTVS